MKKQFLVKIIEKPEYKHKTRIRDHPTTDCWPEPHAIFRPNSVARAALRQTVPRDMAFDGLTDWESAGQLDGDDTLSTRLASKTDYVRARSARRAKKAASGNLAEMYKARHGGGGSAGPI